MVVLMFVNLYTVRLIIKALGLVDYGLFNTIAGVITTSAFISGVLTLSIQRFYSVALGRQDKEELKKYIQLVLISHYVSVSSLLPYLKQ